MAPRAYWKGHVRLALVSFPVRLYAAITSTQKMQLHRIHRESGERVRMQNVVPDEGPVESDDIVMGYEIEPDRYVTVEPEELDALDVESKHTIDLTRFVELSDIDPIYFDRPYFLAPDGDIAAEAFVTIRDALKAAGKVALGKIVLSKRERVVAIQACGKGLLLETLRSTEEVRSAGEYFRDIEDVEVSEDQVDMARSLIEKRTGAFEPDTFVDTYQKKLRELIQAKVSTSGARKAPRRAEPAPGDNVIDLMSALKESLEGEGGGRQAPAEEKPAKSSARRPAKSSSASSRTKAKAAGADKPAPASRGRSRKSA